MQQPLNKLLVVVGPTAVGKSGLSIKLAQKFNGEIISADSMQIYKGLDIGTAKISLSEMQGIPHHLIDIKEPNESFSVSEYQNLAREIINDIFDRQKTPIIVGGTGLYVNSILYNYDFAKPVNEPSNWRKLYQDIAKEKGALFIYNELEKIDPISAKRINPNDQKRVIRALEYWQVNGKLISANIQAKQSLKSIYPCYMIGLNLQREMLYQRINQRVDEMMINGLKEEVINLLKSGCTKANQAMQGIGYRQLIDYFNGKQSLEEAIALIKQESRRYAKRQLTWFGKDFNINWYNSLELEDQTSLKHLFDKIKSSPLYNMEN